MPSSQDRSTAVNDPRRRRLLGFPWFGHRKRWTVATGSSADGRGRWSGWSAALHERMERYTWWLVLGLGIIGIAQQALIYSRHDPLLSDEPTTIFPRRLVLPLLLVYLATSLHVLRGYSAAAFTRLRPVVKLDDAAYEHHMRWALQVPRWHMFLIFAINLALSIYLYIVQRISLPLAMEQTLPSDLPAAAFILGTLILLGWLLWYLVYSCVRYSLGLHRLAQQPLAINVLDPYGLLPFGRLAFLYSLTLVGLILILVVPLGMPEVFDEYLVVVLATLGSFWALVGPLWGVRRQIRRAKQAVLERIHDQFREIQDTLLDGTRFEKGELDDLSDRAEKLIKLRALVWDAPNWPFRSSASALRAVVAALFPLLLVVLQEIIKSYTSYWMGRAPSP
jgi:hypothetical protein